MKKALLVVSYGSSCKITREKTIEVCEKQLKRAFKDYDFFSAYTSERVIEKMKREEHLVIDNPIEALKKLYYLGYEEVLIQSLHIICGKEYSKLKEVIESYKPYFKYLKIGQPLLTEDRDYEVVIKVLKDEMPSLLEGEGIVLMGHGTQHKAHLTYKILEGRWRQEGVRIYMGTLENQEELKDIVLKLRADKVSIVYLMPLMLGAGTHAVRDMASDSKTSWKTILEEAGYKVKVSLKGLGEYEGIQQLFVLYAKEGLENVED